ncbi:MAG: CocE/NonD family hydrolase [Phycisphaeraceae bacterium]
MKTVETFPHRVRTIEHTMIPLPDGTRLAAKMWMPEDAEQNPVPAILEYIPYRKRDGTSIRDSMMHPYLAGHGYACVRVDLRGSGESDGVLRDEYLEPELEDGERVIEWIADQPWCDGGVGMMGISWGGFNGLQIAARGPEALKTIITLCSTDDRYADDVHYMGGCLLSDNLSWASTMFAYNTAPPDPALVGDRWREMWLDRLEHSGLWLEKWLSHQRRDDYWKHGSICEQWGSVQIPVMAVGGWADAYTNAIFRMMANLEGPRQGLIGPWSHKYPHIGVPGPAIGFLQEALRWWDHWLKGRETGIMDEPMLRTYMQESAPPATGYNRRSGRWVGEPSWPSSNVYELGYKLGVKRELRPEQEEVEKGALPIQSPLSLGQFGGKWCSEAAPPDLPDDQREEDGGALVFDTEPLDERLEILGAPVVELELSSNQPVAMVAVRLSNILPSGRITRISYGLLNLTHRHDHENPQPLEPGKRYKVRFELNNVAQAFPAGHRIRLAISTSYWPLVWPAPEPETLNIHTGSSRLILPARPPREEDEKLEMPPAEASPPVPPTRIEPGEGQWRVIRDLAKDESCLEVIKDKGKIRFDEIDWTVSNRAVERYSVQHDDLGTLRGETQWVRTFSRGNWEVKTVTRTVLTSTETDFHLQADLDAFENDARVFCKTWNRCIPRDHV